MFTQIATVEYPFAAIVSCLYSRVLPAIVFDRGELELVVAMYDVKTGKAMFCEYATICNTLPHDLAWVLDLHANGI